ARILYSRPDHELGHFEQVSGQNTALMIQSVRTMNLRKLLLRVLLISFGAAAVFGAGGVMLASSTATWRVVSTCIATGGAALVLMLAAWLAGKEKSQSAGVLAAAIVVVEYHFALLFM